MPTSKIIVQHIDGSPARHVRVVIGFEAGNTHEVYTNKYGEALLEHSSIGRATVYVSGKKFGFFHAPGEYVVTV